MLFHPLDNPSHIELPQKFTFPFCYKPHPLAVMATEKVISLLDSINGLRQMKEGKMYGVLVVEWQGQLGFLMAFSGKMNKEIIDSNDIFITDFVPQIFTLPDNSIPSTQEESRKLQTFIFTQYNMLNALGEERNLIDIFAETPLRFPPSGSGDCCAPKLLQYAFSQGMNPICMAEFWYGNSPKDEVRHHLTYYPSCQGRCKPILSWMLKGMNTDDDPMSKYHDEMEKNLNIIYEDEWLMIVDKPSGMLSVPGKINAPCVADVLKKRLGDESLQLFPVHRLDMFTSGLQILVKGIQTQKDVQRMFENRQVKKQYVALLDGEVELERGRINLPLSADYLNRPCQRIDLEHGKSAITDYEVIEKGNGRTLVNLFPHTGRTHQLRVHCASSYGLGCPIIGDGLYGRNTSAGTEPIRLCLHAQKISFLHPVTGKPIEVCHPTTPPFPVDM